MGGDILVDESGDDTVDGGEGDDTLIGGAGNDRVWIGPGDDVFVPDNFVTDDDILYVDVGRGWLDPVPLPAAGWLLLAGVEALALCARR